MPAVVMNKDDLHFVVFVDNNVAPVIRLTHRRGRLRTQIELFETIIHVEIHIYLVYKSLGYF